MGEVGFVYGRSVMIDWSRTKRIVCPGFEDNMGAIALAENPISSARSKHIDVRFHFVRELLLAKTIDVQCIASEERHADILTKSLDSTPLKCHRRFLLNLPLEGE